MNIEETIESRTNRQCRKSLVFKGIPEQANETWESTENLLAKEISSCRQISLSDARDLLERVHRGHPSNDATDNRPRPIFAALYDWKECELTKEAFRKRNINDGGSIYCEQKFGPLTTARRNLAMKLRKRLMQEGSISRGFVRFPEQLMVRTEAGSRYRLQEDFSKVKISFKRK